MAEYQEQETIVEWFRLQHRRYDRCLRVSQGGNYRGRGVAGAIRARRAKRQGAVTGEADIVVLLKRGQYGSLLIELKRADGRVKMSEAQKEYVAFHNSIGNKACFAIGVDEAIQIIDDYMRLTSE